MWDALFGGDDPFTGRYHLEDQSQTTSNIAKGHHKSVAHLIGRKIDISADILRRILVTLARLCDLDSGATVAI